jgi:hypothetical protein
MASLRARCYMNTDGADATIEELARAMQPHAEMIVSCNVAIYSSMDMNIGINMEELEAAMLVTKSVCEVDARGGIFRPQHVEDAFSRAVERASLREVLIGFAQAVPCSTADLTSLICYKLRVMMAHVRLKYDACGSTPNVHDPIFDVMRKPTNYRKARREERMQ